MTDNETTPHIYIYIYIYISSLPLRWSFSTIPKDSSYRTIIIQDLFNFILQANKSKEVTLVYFHTLLLSKYGMHMDIYSCLATCVHLSDELENHIVPCKIAFISQKIA